jgi:tRNA U54 and U55 pseudouridine synthase Pus10
MIGPKIPDIQFQRLDIDMDLPPDLEDEENKMQKLKLMDNKELNKVINKLVRQNTK